MTEEYISKTGVRYKIKRGKIKPRFVFRKHVPYTATEETSILASFGEIRLESEEGQQIARLTKDQEMKQYYIPTAEGTLHKDEPEAQKYMEIDDTEPPEKMETSPVILVVIFIGVLGYMLLGRK